MQAILLLAALAGPASGESYSLKFRTVPDAGKSVLVREESRQEVDTVVKEDGKEIKRERLTLGDVAEYTQAVQKAKGGLPLKFTNEYTKAETARNGMKFPLPWQGRKVPFELADGKLTSKAEGKPLPKDAVAVLEKQAAARFIDTVLPLLPEKAVEVGDTWKVPAKKAVSGLKVPFDEKHTEASGKLIKVYEKGGVKFAVVELQASVALKGVDGGKLDYKVRIDAAIDGKSTRGSYRADLTITGARPIEVKERKLTANGTTRGTVTLEVSEQK
jgi:hypothetical protein